MAEGEESNNFPGNNDLDDLPIEILIARGIDAEHVKLIKDARIRTCFSLIANTKQDLTELTGLSEDTIDNICKEAKDMCHKYLVDLVNGMQREIETLKLDFVSVPDFLNQVTNAHNQMLEQIYGLQREMLETKPGLEREMLETTTICEIVKIRIEAIAVEVGSSIQNSLPEACIRATKRILKNAEERVADSIIAKIQGK